MCIQLKKSFLAEEGITTNYDGIHLKNCDQERVSGRIKQKNGQTHVFATFTLSILSC